MIMQEACHTVYLYVLAYICVRTRRKTRAPICRLDKPHTIGRPHNPLGAGKLNVHESMKNHPFDSP